MAAVGTTGETLSPPDNVAWPARIPESPGVGAGMASVDLTAADTCNDDDEEDGKTPPCSTPHCDGPGAGHITDRSGAEKTVALNSVPLAYPITKSPLNTTSGTGLEAHPLNSHDIDMNWSSRRKPTRPSSAPNSRTKASSSSGKNDIATLERPRSRTPPPGGVGNSTKFMFSQSALGHMASATASSSTPAAHECDLAHTYPLLTRKDIKTTERHVKKATEGLSRCMACLSSSAALGLYRIQEHTHSGTPALATLKRQYAELQTSIQGVCFDAEYAENTLGPLRTLSAFSSIQHQLNRSIHLKSMLDNS